MGLDGLKLCAAVLVALALAGCSDDGPPKRLLHGERAARFVPVADGVLTQARVLTAADLGGRLDSCHADPEQDDPVVERIGVFGESLTTRNGAVVYACDGGLDPAGERPPPWCGLSVGRLAGGRLLDPRLDILCEDHDHNRLAYAFVTPLAGSHWIGVNQGSYIELYEVLAGLPVRVATMRRIDLDRSSAVFEVTQYDVRGRELARGELEAAVAG